MLAMQAGHGDLVYFPWPIKTLLVFHPEDIKDVMLHHAQRMVKGRQTRHLQAVVGNGVFTSEGKAWREQRRTIANVFMPKQVAAYRPTIRACAAEQMRSWPTAQPFDLGEAIGRMAFDVSGQLFFGGVDPALASAIKEACEQMGRIVFRRISSAFPLPLAVPTRENRRFAAYKRRVDDLVHGVIRDRRTEAGCAQDFLGRILADAASIARPLTDAQIRDEVVTLMIAGFETSSVMIIWTLHLLAQHPEYLTRLQEELKTVDDPADLGSDSLLRAVLKESLRLFPPSPLISRQNIEPITLGGVSLPAGTNFVMSQYVTHRDERFWEKASEFMPERFWRQDVPKFAYFPFSMGPRRCVGEDLATTEALIIIGTLIKSGGLGMEARERRAACEVILRPHEPLMATISHHP